MGFPSSLYEKMLLGTWFRAVRRGFGVQVSGPLNAPEISKLSVDPEMHLTNDFLAISPSIHCNLGFPGHISNNSENGGPAGKLQDSHRK